MKNLIDIIQENELTYLDKEMLKHLVIEYKLSYFFETRKLIFEKYGIYDDCDKLSTYIINEIKTPYLKNNITNFLFTNKDLKKFKNIFFKELNIIIKDSDENFGTYDNKSILNSDNLFDKVTITLYIKNKNDIYDYISTIMHELTHAYDFYIQSCKKDKGYINFISSKYYQTISLQTKLVHTFLYLMCGYERNAFIAQLKGELQTNKKNINNPHDALNFLKTTELYQAYLIFGNILQHYKNFNKDLIKNIVNDYNNLNHTIYSEEKVFKELNKLYIKTKNKLENILPKLCIENLQHTNYEIDARNIIEKINNYIK